MKLLRLLSIGVATGFKVASKISVHSNSSSSSNDLPECLGTLLPKRVGDDRWQCDSLSGKRGVEAEAKCAGSFDTDEVGAQHLQCQVMPSSSEEFNCLAGKPCSNTCKPPSLDFDKEVAQKCPYGWTCNGGNTYVRDTTVRRRTANNAASNWFHVGDDNDVGEAKTKPFNVPAGAVAMSVLRTGGAHRSGSGLFLKRSSDDSEICKWSGNPNGFNFQKDTFCQVLSSYSGGQVYLFAKDNQKSGWGKVYLDDIQFLDSAGKKLEVDCANTANTCKPPSLDFNKEVAQKCPYGWTCNGGNTYVRDTTVRRRTANNAASNWFHVGDDNDVGEAKTKPFNVPAGAVAMSVLRTGGAHRSGSGLFLKRSSDDSEICKWSGNPNGFNFQKDTFCQVLSSYTGGQVYLFAKDNQKSGWGKVYLDDIQFLDSAGSPLDVDC